MTGSNGTPIIKIGCKGLRKFQFEGGQPFECDVIAVDNAWEEQQREFLGPDRKIINITGRMEHMVLFVSQIANQQVDQAQAQAFLKCIRDECDGLADFFVPKSVAKSSSRERPGEIASGSTPGLKTSSGDVSDESAPGSFSTIFEVEPVN